MGPDPLSVSSQVGGDSQTTDLLSGLDIPGITDPAPGQTPGADAVDPPPSGCESLDSTIEECCECLGQCYADAGSHIAGLMSECESECDQACRCVTGQLGIAIDEVKAICDKAETPILRNVNKLVDEVWDYVNQAEQLVYGANGPPTATQPVQYLEPAPAPYCPPGSMEMSGCYAPGSTVTTPDLTEYTLPAAPDGCQWCGLVGPPPYGPPPGYKWAQPSSTAASPCGTVFLLACPLDPLPDPDPDDTPTGGGGGDTVDCMQGGCFQGGRTTTVLVPVEITFPATPDGCCWMGPYKDVLPPDTTLYNVPLNPAIFVGPCGAKFALACGTGDGYPPGYAADCYGGGGTVFVGDCAEQAATAACCPDPDKPAVAISNSGNFWTYALQTVVQPQEVG